MAKVLRVHNLAKELGVTSKQIIEKCCAEGIELKNHMAAISVGLSESIREWFSVGDDVTSVEVAQKVDAATIREASQKKAVEAASSVATAEDEPETAEALPETAAETLETAAEPETVPEVPEPPPPQPVAAPAEEPEAPPPVTPEVPAAAEPETTAEPVAAPPEEEALQPAAEQPEVEPPPPPIVPPAPPEPILPAGPKLVPAPAELRGPRVVRIEAPEPVRPLRRPPAARTATPPAGGAGSETASAPPRRGRGRKGPREDDREASRLRSRSPRRSGRGVDVAERIKEWRDQDLQERRERLASVTGHGLKERKAAEQRRRAAAAASASPSARKAPVELPAPIAVKDFCAAVGAPFAVVSKKLIEHTSRLWTINQSLDAETAELVALDLGVPVKFAHQKTAFEALQDEFAQRERGQLRSRPPVVAMLGHVDHGKTSLLDAIRKTDVAAGEAGGITQHIAAHRIVHEDWEVTFLDTPGHAAFTAMRARGANLTDVVVLVVAADDGVMPQTLEALNHARAAGVQIVVALNKVDLPNIDFNRVYSQLATHELAPADWGGQTDVIKTSAVTGEGISELIAHLSTLSELMDLKADPKVPVQGTVIEAEMREGQGVVAQVLVREGTLRPGQTVVCGPGAGRIRTLRDARGRTLKEAFPGWPVAVTGLDELPSAGDNLYEVGNLKAAKEIAAEVRDRLRSASLEALRKPRTLEDLLASKDESEVPELNVIIRADVQGSVDVLRHALGEFPADKAQLRILHAAVGAVSEADIHLAQASNALVIGFGVVAEERARQLADQLGVEIRLYRVIYDIIEDMHKALAGLLEPIYREEVRGTAEVQQVFNITRVGSVAGCRVSSGTVARNHKVRLVRDGRVIAEGRDMQSLKRYKDDAREVRAGMECGIKLDGFDDLKPGDVIETYEVVEEAAEL